jgi:hypothetical protein
MFGRAQPLVTCLAAVLVARGGPALAQLEGSYKTRGQQVSVQVKTWGENCGSRPRSYSSGSGKVVEVRRAGAHLSIGSQRTDACWSRNPKVQRQRATAGPRSWLVVCETPLDDPRFEHGEYSVEQVDETTLRLREESRYDWRLEGDHCEATVVLTRTYERIADVDEGTPGNPVKAPPPVEPVVPTRCKGPPGAPVKLEVHPGRPRIEPGERVCFRAVGRDANGCPVTVTASWSKARSGTTVGSSGNRLSADGCYSAAPAISDAEGRCVVVASVGELNAQAVVSVRLADISDLIAARLEEGFDEVDAGAEPPVAEARPGAVQGVDRPAVTPADEPSMALVAALIGALAIVMLLGVLIAVARRRRARLDHVVEVEPAVVEHAAVVEPAPAPTPISAGGCENVICPRCRRGFDPTVRTCPTDGVELIPYSKWRASKLAEHRSAVHGMMICPSCAARYDPGTLFCANDGTKLEPVN